MSVDADPLITELEPWVTELVANYEIENWPDCWRSHRGLVVETAALREWKLACSGQGVAANELFIWHDGLGRFRDRLAPLVRKCAGSCSAGASTAVPAPSRQPAYESKTCARDCLAIEDTKHDSPGTLP